ncbi:MAG: hypothetical protein IPP69_16175 [Flavobacteriales bacterium]|nr:hypothetical protein [Flavobacteriales bacterium]
MAQKDTHRLGDKTTARKIETDDFDQPEIHLGQRNLETFHNGIAEEIKALAEGIEANVRKKLKLGRKEMGIEQIAVMFEELTEHDVKVSHRKEDQMKDHLPQINQLQKTYKHTESKAENAFEIAKVNCEAKLDIASTNWLLACEGYESDSKYASSILQSALQQAMHKRPLPSASKDDQQPHSISREIKLTAHALEVSKCLDTYEKSMVKALGDLTKALNGLISEINNAWSALAQSETKLITDKMQALSTFWTAVDNTLKK